MITGLLEPILSVQQLDWFRAAGFTVRNNCIYPVMGIDAAPRLIQSDTSLFLFLFL